MISNTNIKGLVAAMVMTACVTAPAFAGSVSCPDAAKVKAADRALNAVIRQSQKNFFVLSAGPAINSSDYSWMIMAMESGNGFDAAFTSGQNDVKSVTAAAMDEPIEQQGFYLCPYFTGAGTMNVVAVAQQQQGLTFNPGLLNLDVLKAKK